MLLNSLYAFISTLGFGILFNIRGKKLVLASLGGAVCWFAYLLFTRMHISITASLFFATIAGELYSEVMARLVKTPVTTFIICSIIPLVPGSGMYYTMLESVQGNINGSISLGFETLANAGAIAVGILLISSVARLINMMKSKKSF